MWLEGTLASGRLTGSERANTLGAISTLLLAKGEIGLMTELVEEAIVEARAADDHETLPFLIIQRGYAATFRGDLDAAEESLSGALAVMRDRGGRWGTTPVLNALAQVALSRGDFGRAMGFMREGEALSRDTEDTFMLATNLNIQATISQLEGDEERTATAFRESVALSSPLRDSWTLVYGVLYEQDMTTVKAQLDAEAFEACWKEGRAMSVQEAVAVALTENTRATTPTTSAYPRRSACRPVPP